MFAIKINVTSALADDKVAPAKADVTLISKATTYKSCGRDENLSSPSAGQSGKISDQANSFYPEQGSKF